MSIHIRIRCDDHRCEAVFAAAAITVPTAERQARAAGWVTRFGRDQQEFCPACRQRRLEEKRARRAESRAGEQLFGGPT